MKTYITSFLMLLFTVSITNAQIRNTIKVPNKNKITQHDLNNNLDLNKIKKHIKSGKFCYTVNISSAIIFPSKNPRPVKAVDARYITYNATPYLKVERNYLRTNGLLLRSDNNFSRNQGNNYEVLIYPDPSNPKLVNKNQVFMTWRIPESQLRTFSLENVSVRYKPHGILITGDYEVDGIVFGVSIAVIPTTCLI